MSAENAAAAKAPAAKLPGKARRIEEIDFNEYVRNKKTRKHIEELDLENHLKGKSPPRPR